MGTGGDLRGDARNVSAPPFRPPCVCCILWSIRRSDARSSCDGLGKALPMDVLLPSICFTAFIGTERICKQQSYTATLVTTLRTLPFFGYSAHYLLVHVARNLKKIVTQAFISPSIQHASARLLHRRNLFSRGGPNSHYTTACQIGGRRERRGWVAERPVHPLYVPS